MAGFDVGIIDRSQYGTAGNSHLLLHVESFARHRLRAWWCGVIGMLLAGLSVWLMSFIENASRHRVAVTACSALASFSWVLLIACVSFYAMSRGRSALWGLFNICCCNSTVIALLLLTVLEDRGGLGLLASLKKEGHADLPATRPNTFILIVLFGLGVSLYAMATLNIKQLESNRVELLALIDQARNTRASAVKEPAQPLAEAPLPDFAKRPCKVTSAPANAAILLDGVPTGKTTPAEITIWAGKDHIVRVVHEGYVASDKEVFVGTAESPKLHFELKPIPKIRVTTVPEGAEVSIGTEVVLAATPGTFYLGSDFVGMTLVVRKPGFASVHRKISAEKLSDISLRLLPGALVHVDSKPRNAEVIIDGERTGLLTPVEVSVAAGKKHELRLEYEGYTTRATRIKPMKANKSTKVFVDIASTRKAVLRGEIMRLSVEVARWESTLRRLEEENSSIFADSPAVERKRAVDLKRAQDRVEELHSALEQKRDELSGLE